MLSHTGLPTIVSLGMYVESMGPLEEKTMVSKASFAYNNQSFYNSNKHHFSISYYCFISVYIAIWNILTSCNIQNLKHHGEKVVGVGVNNLFAIYSALVTKKER